MIPLPAWSLRHHPRIERRLRADYTGGEELPKPFSAPGVVPESGGSLPLYEPRKEDQELRNFSM